MEEIIVLNFKSTALLLMHLGIDEEFKEPEQKTIDYDAIQQEINNNLLDLKSGLKDCYEFMHEMTIKYIEPVKPECMDLEQENPYAAILVAMLEINKIELY